MEEEEVGSSGKTSLSETVVPVLLTIEAGAVKVCDGTKPCEMKKRNLLFATKVGGQLYTYV